MKIIQLVMVLTLQIDKLRQQVFFWCLLVCVVCFPFSEALVSISAGLLLLQAVVLIPFSNYKPSFKPILPLLIICSVFFVYLVGLFFTHDLKFGIYELQKVIFWIVIPLAFYLSPRLNIKQLNIVFYTFLAAVILSSFVSVIKILFRDFFNIDDIRNITYVSHIRFSFQVILSLIILYYLLVIKSFDNRKKFRVIMILSALWLISFLFLLQSILGIISFIGTAIVVLFYHLFKGNWNLHKLYLTGILALVFIVPVSYVAWVVHDFYNIEKIDSGKLELITPSGNPYSFDIKNKEMENGHLVNIYVCEHELQREWDKRSEVKYDALNPQGYSISSNLKRYLTSRGLRKDSTGIANLTDDDVKQIQHGLTNYIFKNRFISIYPRIYETIWEIDYYFRTGNPNKQSLSQRIEYFKASLILIQHRPLFGIGTGNWKIEYSRAYFEMNSQLKLENQGPSHNQILNYLVKFGVVGFAWITFALLFPVFYLKQQKNIVLWLFFISIAFANLGDANLETHMGLSFFSFFYCLFLWNSPLNSENFIQG